MPAELTESLWVGVVLCGDRAATLGSGGFTWPAR